ncbi:MAG: hypothetical protein ABSC23_11950 [Bryobacteraceae bacterium]
MAAVLIAPLAHAGALPPGASDLVYRGAPVTMRLLSSPPYCFVNGVLQVVNVNAAAILLSGDTENMGVLFTADFLPGGPGPAGPVTFTGTSTFILPGRTDDSMLGTFDTEMLSLNLSGGGLLIRESPTLSSLGQMTVENNGSNNFPASSFFDIFTELSLDGGNTWAPSQGPLQFDQESPEPGSVLLTGTALGLLALKLRRIRPLRRQSQDQ